jgi:hypothetical protein
MPTIKGVGTFAVSIVRRGSEIKVKGACHTETSLVWCA